MGNLKGRSLHFLPVIREAQRSFGRESFAFIFLISIFFNIIQNRTKLLKHPLSSLQALLSCPIHKPWT